MPRIVSKAPPLKRGLNGGRVGALKRVAPIAEQPYALHERGEPALPRVQDRRPEQGGAQVQALDDVGDTALGRQDHRAQRMRELVPLGIVDRLVAERVRNARDCSRIAAEEFRRRLQTRVRREIRRLHRFRVRDAGAGINPDHQQIIVPARFEAGMREPVRRNGKRRTAGVAAFEIREDQNRRPAVQRILEAHPRVARRKRRAQRQGRARAWVQPDFPELARESSAPHGAQQIRIIAKAANTRAKPEPVRSHATGKRPPHLSSPQGESADPRRTASSPGRIRLRMRPREMQTRSELRGEDRMRGSRKAPSRLPIIARLLAALGRPSASPALPARRRSAAGWRLLQRFQRRRAFRSDDLHRPPDGDAVQALALIDPAIAPDPRGLRALKLLQIG